MSEQIESSQTVPKYKQIADTLRTNIADAIYAQGEKLPSDSELSNLTLLA